MEYRNPDLPVRLEKLNCPDIKTWDCIFLLFFFCFSPERPGLEKKWNENEDKSKERKDHSQVRRGFENSI